MNNNTAKQTLKSNLYVFGNLRIMVCAALLAAMSFVLGKFLQIPNPFQDVVRISFENLPLIISGICFGPLVGAVTGAVADIVGCLAYGYPINPIITIGAVTVGFVSGVISNYLVKKNLCLKVAFSVVAAHLLGSVTIKTIGLAAWYLSKYNMGFMELMLWRLLTYSLIGIAEFTIVFILLRNKQFSSLLNKLMHKNKRTL